MSTGMNTAMSSKTTRTRRLAPVAIAMTLGLGLAACGNGDDEATEDNGGGMAAEDPAEPGDDGTEDHDDHEDHDDDDMATGDGAAEMGAAEQTFGAGCAEVPEDGDGSFDGMAAQPVATAASANPLLSTLVTAVGEAGLGDTLNGAPSITVFAPVDDAFEALPEGALDEVLADQELLTAVLTHHVVDGQLSPDELAGEHTTLNGGTIMVEGSGEDFTVGDEGAAVICGNVPTANATVYIIDAVLMP